MQGSGAAVLSVEWGDVASSAYFFLCPSLCEGEGLGRGTLTLIDVPGVEIFRAGTWHGELITNADIAQMERDNSSILPFFRAKLKLTHRYEQPGILSDASFGRVKRFYTQMRHGLLSLYADFERVPAIVAKAVKYFYPERSIEIPPYTRHPQNGKVLTNIISAIAFLGSTPPEVKGMLDEYQALYQQQMNGSRLSKKPLPAFFSQAAPAVYTIAMKQLAAYLKARREELGMKIEDLATATGLAVDLLTQFEAAQAEPDDNALKQLAKALQVEGDADYLKSLMVAESVDDEQPASENMGQTQFEQGVKASEKLYQQEIAKKDRENQRLRMQMYLSGLKGNGLPAVYAGDNMLEFLTSLDATRLFSASGTQTNQLEYMKTMLTQLAKAQSVPTGESELGQEHRKPREYEQAGTEADALIDSIRNDKKCGYADALIEASRRRPDLYKLI